MIHILIPAVLLVVLIGLILLAFVYLAVRPSSYSPIPAMDVVVPTATPVVTPTSPDPPVYQPPVDPPVPEVKGDFAAEKPDPALVVTGKESVLEKYSRLSAGRPVGDPSIVPCVPYPQRRSNVDVSHVARQSTPVGHLLLGNRCQSPIEPIWAPRVDAYEFPTNLTIVYAAQELGPTQQHCLERQFLWCSALAGTGLVPAVHFLSGEYRFANGLPRYGVVHEMVDRCLIMENLGNNSFKDRFPTGLVRDNINLIRKAVFGLQIIHSHGVVIGNVKISTVFAGRDDNVVFADLTSAAPTGLSEATTPRDDLKAVVEMLTKATPWINADWSDDRVLKVSAMLHFAWNLAQSEEPQYEAIIHCLSAVNTL